MSKLRPLIVNAPMVKPVIPPIIMLGPSNEALGRVFCKQRRKRRNVEDSQ